MRLKRSKMNLYIFGVVLTACVLALTIGSAVASAHDHGAQASDSHTQVGSMHYLEGKFDSIGEGPFIIRLHAVRIEDGAEIITLASPSADGSYKFGVQFYDGTEHEVTIRAEDRVNGTVAVEKTLTVSVEAFNPPASLQMGTTAFLLLIIGLGISAGVAVNYVRNAKHSWKGGGTNVA
jgi:hypothetical protein